MKLVIDIPKNDYELALRNDYSAIYKGTYIAEAIKTGTPLIERPKGKWIEVLEWRTEFGSAWHYECSECRARSYKGFKPLERYCPNCGAEMEGGEDENNFGR